MNSIRKYISLAAIIMLAGAALPAGAQEVEPPKPPIETSDTDEVNAEVGETPSFDDLFAEVDAATDERIAANRAETAANRAEIAAIQEETAANRAEIAAIQEETAANRAETEEILQRAADKLEEELPSD